MPTLQLDDDAELAYEIVGDGPPVLLIQGTGVVGEGWRPQVDGLRDRFRLVSFDNRGIGGSTIVGKPTVPRMVADAVALLDAVAFDRAHVVGHSLGGLIALQLALDVPRRVRSLSLLCTFANGRDAAGLTPGMMWLGLRTLVGTRRMRRHAFLQMVASPGSLRDRDRDALAEELRPIFGRDLADQPPIVMQQVRAMARHDVTARLPEITTPTLVVSASHDRVAPSRLGRALADGIPGARFTEIEGAAHGVTVERREEINELLAAHWDDAEHRAPVL